MRLRQGLLLHILALFPNLGFDLIPAGPDVTMILGRLDAGFFLLGAGDSFVNPLKDIGLLVFKVETRRFSLWISIGCECRNCKEY